MFKELDCVALTTDIPDEGLRESDVGTVVHAYPEGRAFIVEFLTLDGSTAAVTEVLPSQIRAVTACDITHARTIGGSGIARTGLTWLFHELRRQTEHFIKHYGRHSPSRMIVSFCLVASRRQGGKERCGEWPSVPDTRSIRVLCASWT